jgi:hypothetical protein
MNKKDDEIAEDVGGLALKMWDTISKHFDNKNATTGLIIMSAAGALTLIASGAAKEGKKSEVLRDVANLFRDASKKFAEIEARKAPKQ